MLTHIHWRSHPLDLWWNKHGWWWWRRRRYNVTWIWFMFYFVQLGLHLIECVGSNDRQWWDAGGQWWAGRQWEVGQTNLFLKPKQKLMY